MAVYRPETPENALGPVEKSVVDAMTARIAGEEIKGEFRILQYDGKGQTVAKPMVELERLLNFKRGEVLAKHGLDAAGSDEDNPGALRKLAMNPVAAQNLVADLKDLHRAEWAAKTLYHLADEPTPSARQNYWKDAAFKNVLKSDMGLAGQVQNAIAAAQDKLDYRTRTELGLGPKSTGGAPGVNSGTTANHQGLHA